MSDPAPVEAPAAPVKAKKPKAAPKDKKPKAKPTHPPVAAMVVAAIKSLKERGGSSLPAIKKYLTATYKVDCGKLAPFIKKFLKTAVASGKLVQTKGKGASGSFKLPAKEKAEKKAAKPKKAAPKAKKASATKVKKPAAKKLKKPVAAKKPKAAPKKPAAAKKPKAAKKPAAKKPAAKKAAPKKAKK